MAEIGDHGDHSRVGSGKYRRRPRSDSSDFSTDSKLVRQLYSGFETGVQVFTTLGNALHVIKAQPRLHM